MGLAMAYGTVVAHNGWIQVQNLPEAGAAFDVILPAFKLYSEGENHSS